MAGSGGRTGLEGTHVLADLAATHALAARLADALVGGETVELVGELGAGKTAFTKALASALGVPDAHRAVTSPTFGLHHRYEGGRLVVDHTDAYRLRGGDDFAALDLVAGHGPHAVLVVEWADRVRDELPFPRWTVALAVAPGGGRVATVAWSE